MNYKVLYRKYRPDSFDSLIGQKHIVEILKNSIKENRLAHAYLFSGPRGTGKTSTARILAKAINCRNNKSGFACGECDSCLTFNGNPDIIEIDAASNNGVDEIRELINNVKIMPTSLKYKVYIIDEVHMLSASAFNALLLTLEEPPEHVVFILATTNLESVPITIVSRCQRFEFHRITEDDIVDRLKYVCDSEGIKYEEDGLREIAILADGGLRDALSILDQLSKNEEVITNTLVSNEIGSISNKKIDELINYLDHNDIDNIEAIFNEVESTSLNYKVFIKKMISSLSSVGVKILGKPDDYRLSYDDVKNLVMELNDVIMKINVSISPYLLIKMIVLNYVEVTKKVVVPKLEKKDIVEAIKPRLKQEKTEVNFAKKIEEDTTNIDIRINNCFVNASKNYLTKLKELWIDFVSNIEDALVKGLVTDTLVVTASDTYAIVEVTIPHKDREINNKLNDIEDLFNKYNNTKYKLVFIDTDKWNKEKSSYITNIKNGYKYTYKDEVKLDNKDEINMSELKDIFDIDKIEVE